MNDRHRFELGLHRPERARDEMREELEFHVRERAARLEARGLSPDAALAEARRLLGDSLDTATTTLGASAERKERKLRMRDWMHDLVTDVRYAMRGLVRRPGFSAVAILTLAIGVGGNTAIYTAVDALLLRALPFQEPDRLMDLVLTGPESGPTEWSYPKAEAYRRGQTSFASLALYASRPMTLGGENPERITIETVSADYLRTLGLRVARGADFGPAVDAGPGAGAFALISDGLWQRRYAAAPDVVGKMVQLDNRSYVILGVLPPGFRGIAGDADALINLTSRDAESLGEAWSLEFSMVGRLKPGVTPEHASAETQTVGAEVYRAFPQEAGTLTTAKSFEWGADARAFDSIRVAPGLRRSLLVLFAAVGLVLLIACVNLANLLLARASARRREIAVRLAIGATRLRLVRLFLTESLVLALAGGVLGVAFAWWAARALAALNPASALQAQALAGGIGAVSFEAIRLDGSALLFTLLVTLFAGVAFGLVPAIGGTRADLSGGLKDDGGAPPPARHGLRIDRRALVVAEVALAIVLLAGSGLMIRSLVNLLRVDLGFQGAQVLTLRMSVPQGSVAPDSMPGFYDAVNERLGALPGVRGVALADCAPVSGGCNGTIMTFTDRPRSATGNAMVGVHWVSPGWFALMGIGLKRGRALEEGDRRGTPKVIVINEEAARRYFPGEDPVGRQVGVYQGGFHTGATIVGVVGDVRFGTLETPAQPDVYISYGQSSPARAMVFVKTDADPASLAGPARVALGDVAPFAPVYDVRLMRARVAEATGQARLSAGLLAGFAVMALALAVMGIYGVMSFAVTLRTREVGIRVALGADRGDVLRLFTREGLVLCGIGMVLGLAGALVATRVLRTMLYGVVPGDPVTYVAIVVVVGAAALLASWVPARRAAGLDPVRALN